MIHLNLRALLNLVHLQLAQSLKAHVEFWSNSVQAPDFIISTIVDGYIIPFFELPESYFIPNRSSAFKFKDFVNEDISELIERGCVMEVDIPPVFINPLHVVQQSSGKCRLILDLSNLNKFVWKQSARYEDIRTVFDLFQSGYFFFTFDLKSGYHHVEIFPDHRCVSATLVLKRAAPKSGLLCHFFGGRGGGGAGECTMI